MKIKPDESPIMEDDRIIEELTAENNMLRNELRVARKAAEITAEYVVKQFEQTEREKHRFQVAAANLEGFKLTLDQVRDSVFMFEPNMLRFIYVNQGGIRQTGYSEAELLKLTPLDLWPALSREHFEKILASLVAESGKFSFLTTKHKVKNGGMVSVEIFLQYIAPEGIQGRFFTIVRDISERLQEEKEKEQLQTRLLHTQKLESVGALAAGIAHEINTPVQYIGSNISFLEEAFADLLGLIEKYRTLLADLFQEQKYRAMVQQINDYSEEIDTSYLYEEIPQAIRQSYDGVDKVRTLVLAMKEFSHPGGKEKIQTDLNKIIETTVQISRNEWKYVAEIVLHLDPDLPMILCHANEIGQVILNILTNAAHAIAGKREQAATDAKGTITISTREIDTSVEIMAEDTGGGIPQDIIGKIFDPFFTTKEVGQGTGQGLAISRDVINNKHNGELTVSSIPGQGAIFIIRLPKT